MPICICEISLNCLRTDFRSAGVPPAVFNFHPAQKCRRKAGATTKRALFSVLDMSHLPQNSSIKYFAEVHRASFLQFWNFFLTSGAHTRKRTIASLRWIGSLLRGENGSRSECANRPHKGNAAHRVGPEKTFPEGAVTIVAALFCVCRACSIAWG